MRLDDSRGTVASLSSHIAHLLDASSRAAGTACDRDRCPQPSPCRCRPAGAPWAGCLRRSENRRPGEGGRYPRVLVPPGALPTGEDDEHRGVPARWLLLACSTPGPEAVTSSLRNRYKLPSRKSLMCKRLRGYAGYAPFWLRTEWAARWRRLGVFPGR